MKNLNKWEIYNLLYLIILSLDNQILTLRQSAGPSEIFVSIFSRLLAPGKISRPGWSISWPSEFLNFITSVFLINLSNFDLRRSYKWLIMRPPGDIYKIKDILRIIECFNQGRFSIREGLRLVTGYFWMLDRRIFLVVAYF